MWYHQVLLFLYFVSTRYDFYQLRSTESRYVIGPSNILFAGVCVSTFQPGNFTGCGREGVSTDHSTDSHDFLYKLKSSWVPVISLYQHSTRTDSLMIHSMAQHFLQWHFDQWTLHPESRKSHDTSFSNTSPSDSYQLSNDTSSNGIVKWHCPVKLDKITLWPMTLHQINKS